MTPAAQPGGREPAPGDLALVQDFVNTNDVEGRRDRLADRQLAEDWLLARRLLSPGDRVDDAALRWLVDVREALRALASTNNGAPPDVRAQAVLNETASRTVSLEFARGDVHASATGVGIARAIGTLLGVVAEAMREGRWVRMKVCRRDACRWLFYDHSRNRVSNWCSMSICGNRAKTRAYRSRRRNAGSAG